MIQLTCKIPYTDVLIGQDEVKSRLLRAGFDLRKQFTYIKDLRDRSFIYAQYREPEEYDPILAGMFKQAWRRSCGMKEEKSKPRRPDLETLYATQWNDQFERLMRNRLVMGAFRYGMFSEQKHTRYDNSEGIEKHLALYRETGNGEHLVDIANLALVEYTRPANPKFHFQPLDDGDHHTEKV